MPPTGGGGGNWGSLPPVPSVRGAPNSAELFQIRSCSSFTSQSSSFKRFLLLDFKSACFLLRAHAGDANFKIMHTLVRSYVTSAQPLARVVKTAKQRRQLAGICTVCMRKKEPEKPTEHTSWHVKSQNFLGACPQTPPDTHTQYGPHFCICPGPPQSSQQSCK